MKTRERWRPICPALPPMVGADEILILPGNDIGTVPFALLRLPGSPGMGMVIDAAPVTIAPSAAALVRAPDRLAPGLAGQMTTGPIGFTRIWTGTVVVGDPQATDDPDWPFPPLAGCKGRGAGDCHPLCRRSSGDAPGGCPARRDAGRPGTPSR